LFVFACFCTLMVAVDLFLPIVLAGFLGFLLTPSHQMVKENRFAKLLGTTCWHTRLFYLLLCLLAALRASLASPT